MNPLHTQLIGTEGPAMGDIDALDLGFADRTYRIRTLQDLWNLESAEQIERALREIGTAMIRMRRLQDEVLAGASAALHGTPQAHELVWPDIVEWVDDHRGKIQIQMAEVDGRKTLMVDDALSADGHSPFS